MTIAEIWSRFLITITPLMPMIIIVVSIITIITIALLVVSNNTWVNKKSFSLVSLFSRFSLYDAFCLACAFLNLIFVLFFVIRFKKITNTEYIIYIICSTLFIFNIKNPKKILLKTPWLIVEAGGLFLLNSICKFISDTYIDVWYIMLYILVGTLLSLLAIYRFILAIDEISNQREFIYEQ